MPRTPHVALLIETSREHGRGILRGVARYIHECNPWSISFRPYGLEEPVPLWLKHWEGDGILARIDDRKMAEAVKRTGVPAVDLRGRFSKLSLPFIGVDNRAVAQLAMQHFLDRGFQHFAFCGLPHGFRTATEERREYYQRGLEKMGHCCHLFPTRNRQRHLTWESQQNLIAEWIVGLPKPVAVLAGSDEVGLRVLDACRRAGVNVPDAVAVVGIDNDEHVCELATPPLTSIDVSSERVGFEAAKLLERLMAGKAAPRKPKYVPPQSVVTRRSSDVFAIDDRDVVQAVRFIRDNACQGIRVIDVLKVVPLSRSSLERRFRKTLGRTPKAEILRIQLGRAKQLLAQTDLSLSDIAAMTGFRRPEYFSEIFRKKMSMPPGAFRRDHQR